MNVDCREGGYALACRNGVLDGRQLYRLARQKHLRREEKIKKTIRGLLCVALAISMLCASALAEIELIPQSKTMYLNSRDGKGLSTTREIAISGINSDSKITAPKSSKPSVLKIDHLTVLNEHTVPYEGEKVEHSSATLFVGLNKPGRSTVSVNVDGETYRTKLKVAQYVNPVKKLVVTGISGKNLKSLFRTSGSAVGTLASNAKAGQVVLTAADGWRIRKIGFISLDGTIVIERKTGVKTYRMSVPAMKKGSVYLITAMIENAATGGFIDTMYMLK